MHRRFAKRSDATGSFRVVLRREVRHPEHGASLRIRCVGLQFFGKRANRFRIIFQSKRSEPGIAHKARNLGIPTLGFLIVPQRGRVLLPDGLRRGQIVEAGTENGAKLFLLRLRLLLFLLRQIGARQKRGIGLRGRVRERRPRHGNLLVLLRHKGRDGGSCSGASFSLNGCNVLHALVERKILQLARSFQIALSLFPSFRIDQDPPQHNVSLSNEIVRLRNLVRGERCGLPKVLFGACVVLARVSVQPQIQPCFRRRWIDLHRNLQIMIGLI